MAAVGRDAAARAASTGLTAMNFVVLDVHRPTLVVIKGLDGLLRKLVA